MLEHTKKNYKSHKVWSWTLALLSFYFMSLANQCEMWSKPVSEGIIGQPFAIKGKKSFLCVWECLISWLKEGEEGEMKICETSNEAGASTQYILHNFYNDTLQTIAGINTINSGFLFEIVATVL